MEAAVLHDGICNPDPYIAFATPHEPQALAASMTCSLQIVCRHRQPHGQAAKGRRSNPARRAFLPEATHRASGSWYFAALPGSHGFFASSVLYGT